MKQVANYDEKRIETDDELKITMTNYNLALDEFPLSMYKNLIDEIKDHKEADNSQDLRIRIRGNKQSLSLASIRENENQVPYLYISADSNGLNYSTVEPNKDPKFLIMIRPLETFTAVNFVSSEMSIYIKNRGE